MFLNNKYTKWYYMLISNPCQSTYYEIHHIIPVCLGGSNEPDNLVKISARKHYILHLLLTKMFEPKTKEYYKMVKAFIMMHVVSSSQDRYTNFNSKIYEKFRKIHSTIKSIEYRGSGNSQFNTIWVSNIELEKCIKIQNSELDHYISLGYIKKRIMDFNKYKKLRNIQKYSRKEKSEKLEEYNKIKIKNKIDRKKKLDKNNIQKFLPLYQKYLESELSLRKFKNKFELPYSHVYLHKMFKLCLAPSPGNDPG